MLFGFFFDHALNVHIDNFNRSFRISIGGVFNREVRALAEDHLIWFSLLGHNR